MNEKFEVKIKTSADQGIRAYQGSHQIRESTPVREDSPTMGCLLERVPQEGDKP